MQDDEFIGSAVRPPAIEEPTNRMLVHPAADWLVPHLRRAGISPNAVSLAGALAGVLAGVSYYFGSDPAFATLGFLLMVAWHVLDGADGKLARATQQTTPLGRIIDGVCDYTAFGVVYFAIVFAARDAGAAWWVWVLGVLAAAAHAHQAAAYEYRRALYLRRARGEFTTAAAPAAELGGLAYLLAEFQRALQSVFRASDLRLDLSLIKLKSEDPARFGDVLARYLEVTAPEVRTWALLSANIRTLAIYLFHLAGWPTGYFWFEIIVLSSVFAALRYRQIERERSFVAWIETGYGLPQKPVEAGKIDPDSN